MSLNFGFALFQAGGKNAAKGLRDFISERAPNLSADAGQIVAESKLDDDLGEVLKRTRTRLNEVQTAFNLVSTPYQQKVAAAEGIQKKIDAFTAKLNDPATPDSDKAGLQAQIATHSTSLEGLVGKLTAASADYDKKKHDLEETQAFLHQAEEAFKAKAAKTVAGVGEAKDLRQKIDQANLERDQAKQQAADSRIVSGLATDDEGDNPAVAAMKRTLAKAEADKEQYKFKAETLTNIAHKDEDDDPIVKAAIAEATGAAGTSQSVTDRLSALRR